MDARSKRMDLSDFQTTPERATPATTPDALDANALIAQMGAEVATLLSSALARVTTLASTGKIGRDGVRALREEIEQARRVGMMGQQVSRLASGRIGVTQERIDLTALVREALRQRAREIEARGTGVRQLFAAAEIKSDATLVYSLLQALFDWSFEHAVSRIDLQLHIKPWPTHAQLACAFLHRPLDQADSGPAPLPGGHEAALDTLSWRLVQHTAAVLGLPLTRADTPSKTVLTVEFPDTLSTRLQPAEAGQAEGPPSQSYNSQPLAGRHVLVLASRREVRNLVRDALRPMGLMLDFVPSVDKARQFCSEGLPHAVVHEASLGGQRFERLRAEMLADLPTLAFIQIAESGKAFEVLSVGDRQFASVGRDAILESLPAAMLFELTRTG
jgi:hypothetical protein